jgi:hypothetical protein
MKLLRLMTVQAISEMKNIRLSRKSKRKIKKAANQSVDAAVSVAADVLKGLRKQK